MMCLVAEKHANYSVGLKLFFYLQQKEFFGKFVKNKALEISIQLILHEDYYSGENPCVSPELLLTSHVFFSIQVGLVLCLSIKSVC